MNEKGFKKFAVLLAFDVNVNKEARELSEEFGVMVRIYPSLSLSLSLSLCLSLSVSLSLSLSVSLPFSLSLSLD